MANGENPFAIFQSPEFGNMDLFEKWMNFQQVAATHQPFLDLTTEEREQVRKNVVGYNSTKEFYPQVKTRMAEYDPEVQQRIFNSLMKDDPRWEQMPATERQATRGEIVQSMDVGETHTFGGQGVKYQPPEGYEIPHRPLSPAPTEMPVFSQQPPGLREQAAQFGDEPFVVEPLQPYQPPEQPVEDEQTVDTFSIFNYAPAQEPEAQKKWAETLLQPFTDVASTKNYAALPQDKRSALFTEAAEKSEGYKLLPLEAKIRIREVFVNDSAFNQEVGEVPSPEGFFEALATSSTRGYDRGKAAWAEQQAGISEKNIRNLLAQYEKDKSGRYADLARAKIEEHMPQMLNEHEMYFEKWGGANAAMKELGVSEASSKINMINLEVMDQYKDKPPEKGLIRGTADWFNRTKAFLDEVGKQDAWGDLAQFVGETTLESAVSYGMTALPVTIGLSLVAGPVVGPAAGAYSGSYILEFSAAMNEALEEAGVDTTDPQALMAASQNPEVWDAAKKFGKARAVPIAFFDALSAGIAGTAGRALSAPTRELSKLARTGAGAGILGQAALLGGAGELTAQKVAGQEIDPLAIGIEAVAEVAQAPAEVTVAGAAERYGPVNIRAKQLQLGVKGLTDEERIAAASTLPQEGKYGDVVSTWNPETNRLSMGVMGKNGKLISPVQMTLTPEEGDAYAQRRKDNEISGVLPSISPAAVLEKLERFEARQREGDMSRDVGTAHLANIIDSLNPEEAETVMDRAQEIANERLNERGLPSEMFEQGETMGVRETDVTPDEMEMINFGAVRDALYEHLGKTPPVEEQAAVETALPEDLAEQTAAFEARVAERERPRDQIDEVQEELAGAGYGEAATVLGKYRTGEPLTADEFAAIEDAQAQVDPDVGAVLQNIRDAALAPIDEVQRKADVNTVLNAINEGNETMKELIAATGLEPDRVRIYAKELAEAGRVDARPFEGVNKPARFTPVGKPTAGEAQQTAELPAPTRTRGSQLAVGDLIESPDLGPATITKIEKQGQGIRVVSYRDAIGNQETMSVRPTTYTDVYQKGEPAQESAPQREAEQLEVHGTPVFKNPSESELDALQASYEPAFRFHLTQMDPEVRQEMLDSERRFKARGERPGVRWAYDENGNTYAWRADLGTHMDFMPELAKRYGAEGIEHSVYRPRPDEWVAEEAAEAAEQAQAEEAAPPTKKELLQDKADRYKGLINAAETTAELRAVEEQWGREKSKPWGKEYGVDAAFARKRRLLKRDEAVEAALTPGPREDTEAAEPAPETPAVVTPEDLTPKAEGPVVTPEEAGRQPSDVLYGVDGTPIGEGKAEQPGEVASPPKKKVLVLPSQREAIDALNKMAGVTEDPVLEEYAEEDTVPAEEETRGEEEVQEEEAVEETVEEKPKVDLTDLEQQVFDEIEGGRTTISEIQRAIGKSKRLLNKTVKSLNKKGVINLELEPTERKGEERLRASLPDEGQKTEKYKKKSRSDQKADKKLSTEERSKQKLDKLKEDLDAPVTREQEMAEARKREGEQGVVRINIPERRENTNRTDAVNTHTGWEYKTVRDFLMRGKTGMSSAMKKAWDQAAKIMEGHRREAQADFKAINAAVDNLVGSFRWLGRKRKEVNRIVNMFQRGEDGVKTPAELAAVLKVPDDNKHIKVLADARERNQKRHQEIMDSPHIPDVVKEAMKDEQFYLRLVYTRYLTDKRLFGRWRKFKPDETNRQEAIKVLAAAYDKEIQRAIAKYDAWSDVLPSSFDFVGFLEEFNSKPEGFEELSPDVRDRLVAFRKSFRNWKQAIQFHTSLDGKAIYAVREADALRRYATVGVEQLLTKGGRAGILDEAGGRLDVNNLERRVLSDVFRRLYGEIEDPAVLQALSVEAQGTLLSQFMFFEEMLHHGQDIVWAEGKADSVKLTAKLGDEKNEKDVFKYGSLAGTYVDPLFKQFLDRKGAMMIGLNNIIDLATVDETVLGAAAGKAFKTWQGTTRMMALMTLGAWWRNYLSSYLTFAMQAGDVMHSDFNKKFFKYTFQALKVAVGNEAANREMAEDMKSGAFAFSSASVVSDFEPATKDHLGRLNLIGAMKSVPRKIKESYILIDYAAKKAAYESRLALAKERVPDISQEDAETYAREHVERFYQNADRVPAFVATIGRVGMGDFLGFQYDSGRMAINAGVNVMTGLDRTASKPGDRLYRWKGILNKYPELQDTWESLVGFTAARGIGLGIWGPGQYLLAVGPANAAMSVTFGQILQGLKVVDEDEKIEETTAEIERALNELMPFFDANAQKYTMKLVNPSTGKVSFRVVPLSNQFGNAFEDQAIGIAQRAGVAEESLGDIASSMLRPENIFNQLPIGMTYQNAVRAITGYDPQTQMVRSNLIDSMKYAKSGRFGDAGEEAADAMMGWLADTTGGVGRMWKRYKVYEQREGRTPVTGSRKRALEKEGVDKWLDVAMPMIRPLRVVTIDEDEIRRILPYKLGPLASKVAGMRAGMREPVRKARDYVEGATEEELAAGLAAKDGYIIALRDIEERIKDMRPVIDAVGIPNETLVQELMDGLPVDSRMRRAEAEAVVNGTVDIFEFSDDFYQPEQKPTGLMKGDDIIEKALRDNPNVSWIYMYNMLAAQKYAVGTHPKFQARFLRIKSRIYK